MTSYLHPSHAQIASGHGSVASAGSVSLQIHYIKLTKLPDLYCTLLQVFGFNFQVTMFWSIPVLTLALAYPPSARAQNDTASELPAILTTDIIEGLGNNSLFTRWRPTYHFISPAGWMNVRSTIVEPEGIHTPNIT